MKKNYIALRATLFIVTILGLLYLTVMPHFLVGTEKALAEFSTNRALEQVGEISKKPHYIGSANHDTVANYLISELKNMDLEIQTQEGYTLSDWGNLVKSKNIIARIRGTQNTKALLLLSHYDSAPHSYSLGASDDGSGLATILEGIRVFLHNKTPHKNDIIILFTDAEELGLNGAALFVTKNKLAKEVGLVLNFEARGTSGPSYMLMEVPEGNSELVYGFSQANSLYPVSNSLMYSIYKMLPNDTDLTVFREQAKIPGFNFAFIDGHFNYHTIQDDSHHLNPESLEHQAKYLMPLLKYFSNANLKILQSNEDYVYFSIPFNFISYPFSWIFPLLILAILILVSLLFIGTAKKIVDFSEIKIGYKLFFYAIFTSGLVTFVLWQILLLIYPNYKEILQGFTYNGHDYIVAFVLLSLCISFLFYANTREQNQVVNYYIAPLTVWILLNIIFAFILPGASFFIIPVYFGLFKLAYFLLTQRVNRTLNLFLSIPALLIYVPFVFMFPIGLGLKIMAASAVLTVLIFGLLLPIISFYRKKRNWAIFFGVLSLGFLIKAHFYSDFEKGKAKPNSLLYLYDRDTNKAYWTTYDNKLDEWTETYLGKDPQEAMMINSNVLFSKYKSKFTFMNDAPVKALKGPSVDFLKDSIIGNKRFVKIKITPNRKVNRYDIFADEKITFRSLRANGVTAVGQKSAIYERNGKRILSYYIINNEPMELEFTVSKGTVLDMDLLECSFDLLNQKDFNIQRRKSWMMPKPFVLTDAIIYKQKIRKPKPILKPITAPAIRNAIIDTIANL